MQAGSYIIIMQDSKLLQISLWNKRIVTRLWSAVSNSTL